MEFSRQEYWNGLPVPTPRDLLDPGIEDVSLTSPALAGGFFYRYATLEFPLIQRNIQPNDSQRETIKALHPHLSVFKA